MRLAQELPDRGASIAPRVAAILGRRARLGRARARPPRSTRYLEIGAARVRPAVGDDRLILALDQGTTSSRAIAFGRDGRPVASGAAGVRAAVPVAGPRHPRSRGDLVEPARGRARGRRRGRRRRADRRDRDHQPARDDDRLGPRDRRADRRRDRLAEPDHGAGLRAAPRRAATRRCSAARTGLPLDAYFTGPKIAHILDAVPGARSRAERGELAFGTVDSFLLWRLTARGGGACTPPTSRTPAGRSSSTSTASPGTTSCSSSSACPRAVLPEVRPSSGVFGETDAGPLRPPDPDRGARRRPAGGDVRPGLLRAGPGEEHLRHRRVPAAEHRLGAARLRERPADDGRLAARARRAGDVRPRGLGVHRRRGRPVAARRAQGHRARRGRRGARRLASTDTGGVYLVPAFVGLGAPYWDPVRPRHDRRHHPRDRPRRDRAGDARVDRLPGRRRARGDGRGRRRAAATSCGSTGAPRRTTCCSSSRRTCSASRSSGRSSPRRPRSARRTSPGWRSATGTASTTSSRTGRSSAGSSRRCRPTGADRCCTAGTGGRALAGLDRARLNMPESGARQIPESGLCSARPMSRHGRDGK